MRSVVVFPQPEAPKNVMNSPLSMERSISLSTSVVPKLLLIPFNSSNLSFPASAETESAGFPCGCRISLMLYPSLSYRSCSVPSQPPLIKLSLVYNGTNVRRCQFPTNNLEKIHPFYSQIIHSCILYQSVSENSFRHTLNMPAGTTCSYGQPSKCADLAELLQYIRQNL